MAFYVFVEMEISNRAGLEPYRAAVNDTIVQYGGRFLVRAGATRLIEGGPEPKTIVILEFPDAASFDRWWNSPEYRKSCRAVLRTRPLASSQWKAWSQDDLTTLTGCWTGWSGWYSPSCGPKGVARREFDVVAAWSVCRLGRSLSDLIGLLGELRSRDIDLYLHQQALDTSTPSGRMLFGMLGVFSEFERAMIRDRVMAGLDRARSSGKRLGRPRTTPFQVQRIRLALDEGRGVRETARLLKVSAAKVSEVRRMSATSAGLHP